MLLTYYMLNLGFAHPYFLCSWLVNISYIEKWIPLGGNTKWKHFLTEHLL